MVVQQNGKIGCQGKRGWRGGEGFVVMYYNNSCILEMSVIMSMFMNFTTILRFHWLEFSQFL
jgi:hypothetical protein